MTGYEYSRNWFDWCFENPEKIKPAHTALYFFIIEHCNRLGWKDKFGLPTQMAMEAIGIKNWRTYSNAFEDLVKWDFVKVHERSKNQWSATVIALVKKTKANTKALTIAAQKHRQKHIQKQSSSTVVIDKPINNEHITKEGEKPKRFIPPTLLEVRDEVFEKAYSLDPETFIAFYESKNWMVGKNKMKNWKAALVTWNKRERVGGKKAHPITQLDPQKKYEKW